MFGFGDEDITLDIEGLNTERSAAAMLKYLYRQPTLDQTPVSDDDDDDDAPQTQDVH